MTIELRPSTVPQIRDFTWDVDEGAIADLRRRIDATRWPTQLPAATDERKGITVADARTWAEELAAFDVAALRDEIYAWPQHLADIDGQRIHFTHIRSDRADAIPLLALHGWPGTPLEFYDLIPALTAPESDADPAFHLVIPSHPGVGFSGMTTEPGWGVDRTARAYAALMAHLEYDHYLVQGGDHGAIIGPHVARVDRDHVLGVHVNAATIGFMPMGDVDDETVAALTDRERARLAAISRFMSDGNGYNVIQATRPQTIGYGLEDSPAALLTWMVDKIREWTHSTDALADPHYRSRHLGDILIYWLTRTATSAADNVYAHYPALFSNPHAFDNSEVPTAVIAFAEDISIRRFAEYTNTITRWTDVDEGGHFAALEQPELLLTDIRAFTRELVE